MDNSSRAIANRDETDHLLAEWDTVLYQAMLTVFLPDLLGPGDKYLLGELKLFSSKLPDFLRRVFGTNPCPCNFSEKIRVALEFSKIVKQYYYLNHLALSANNVSLRQDVLDAMAQVWREVPFDIIVSQSLYVCMNAGEVMKHVQESVFQKLVSRANVSQWAEWVFAMTEEFLNFV
jgi:hypothetical protein